MRMRLPLLLAAATAAALAATAEATNPGQANVGPGNKHVTFSGSAQFGGAVSDPAFCPPGQIDPANLACEHFRITIEAAGSVTASIAHAPEADFDLFACEDDPTSDAVEPVPDACTGGRELDASTSGGTSETVTFSVASPRDVELRIVPFFAEPGAAFTGEVTYSESGGGDGGGDDGSFEPPADCTPPLGDRKAHGGGELAPGATLKKPHFSVSTEWKVRNRRLKVKARFKEDGLVDFKADRADCVVYNDVERSATVYGTGTNKKPDDHDTRYVIKIVDGGKGGDGDFFEIHLEDGYNNAGPPASGDIKYEVRG